MYIRIEPLHSNILNPFIETHLYLPIQYGLIYMLFMRIIFSSSDYLT